MPDLTILFLTSLKKCMAASEKARESSQNILGIAIYWFTVQMHSQVSGTQNARNPLSFSVYIRRSFSQELEPENEPMHFVMGHDGLTDNLNGRPNTHPYFWDFKDILCYFPLSLNHLIFA